MRRFRSTLAEPVALVPTMGMLHQGHASLVRLAARRASSVIVSVYVNPTQLALGEQRAYPVNLVEDVGMLQRLQEELCQEDQGYGTIKAVFAPTDQDMYPHGTDLWGGCCSHVVTSPRLTRGLEGKGQATHFVGVGTICLKLFNVVTPQLAVFGEKDYQQTIVVRRLAEELLLKVEIVVGTTIRDADGLAVSSRNVFLGPERRGVAVVLWKALKAGAAMYQSGQCQRRTILAACKEEVLREQDRQNLRDLSDRVNFDLVYFGLNHLQTLEDIEEVEVAEGALLSGAIQMLPYERIKCLEDVQVSDRMSVRLIDSLVL